jgi:hypothetical protein
VSVKFVLEDSKRCDARAVIVGKPVRAYAVVLAGHLSHSITIAKAELKDCAAAKSARKKLASCSAGAFAYRGNN